MFARNYKQTGAQKWPSVRFERGAIFCYGFTDKLIATLEKEILDLNAELSALKQTLDQLLGTGIKLVLIYVLF